MENMDNLGVMETHSSAGRFTTSSDCEKTTAVSSRKVLDQIRFLLSFTWPINFFGHPYSAGMTKHGAEITETRLI